MQKISIKKLWIAAVIAALGLALAALCACSGLGNDGKIVVKDVQGTEFKFDEPIQKVVSTHNPTLNAVVILGNGTTKYLAGWGNRDKAEALYTKILPDWNTITSIAGDGSAVNKETVIKLHPDLALVPENLADMKDKDYEGTDVKTFVALPKKESFQTVTDSIKLIAKLFGEDDRAKEVTDKFNEICDDVKQATSSVPEDQKAKVLFLGSKLYKAATSDMIQTQVIEGANAINVAKDEFDSGFFATTDAETIVKLAPEVIFFPNYAKFTVNDLLNDEKLQSVPAIKNKKVYMFPSKLEPWDYNVCSCCLGVAWAAHTLYPDLYSTEKLNQTCVDYMKLLYNHTFTPEELGIN